MRKLIDDLSLLRNIEKNGNTEVVIIVGTEGFKTTLVRSLYDACHLLETEIKKGYTIYPHNNTIFVIELEEESK